MSIKWFDGYSWGLSFFLSLVFVFLSCICSRPFGEYFGFSVTSLFCFDSVSFYLMVLSVLLTLSLLVYVNSLGFISLVMLTISVSCSILCYCCVHSFWFWCFYEMSILSLLVLLIVESPYSERYVAAWYLLGYAILSSLPMLFCLIYLSLRFGVFKFGCWSFWGEAVDYAVLLVLCVLFIVKIPLPPFHMWLPLVHAEATSPVSVCLSGYMMKLGILGLCRVCGWLLPDFIFGVSYLSVCLMASLLFFLGACGELDGKRWLAFMSLAHIVMACVCLGVADFDGVELATLYCLGHGLSAGLMFIFLWVGYDVTGSRKWVVLKSVDLSGSAFSCLSVMALCTVMSLPPVVQFFCEVSILTWSFGVSVFFFFFFGWYLFFSGLVPLFFIGMLLSRHVSLRCCVGGVFGSVLSVVFLVVWCFLLFVVC